MTLAFLIYLVSFLPKLASIFMFLGVASLIIAGLFALAWVISRDGVSCGKPLKWNKMTSWLIATGIFLITLNAAIPEEKTAWLMIGGYAAQTAYESEEGQKYKKLIFQKIDEALQSKADVVKESN